MEQTWDVVVVGGGAAGLSGAMALGRSRRSVLVLDAGTPRNATAGHAHNYLGREGVAPADLLAAGRAELAPYDVQVRTATAVRGRREDDRTLALDLVDGSTVRGRRVLLATGVVDDLPPVDGLAQAWGSTVLHCPYCHGWEVRDRALAVLATGPMALHQVQLFRQLSEDVVLLTHTVPELTDDQREQLAALRVRVVDGEVASWRPGAVTLASGQVVARDALVVASTPRVPAELPTSLGLVVVDLELNGLVLGERVEADATGRTDVPGVFVAGNLREPMAQLMASAAAGTMAGAVINADLIAEDLRAEVELARMFTVQAWEERYRAKPAGIWSGEPNAVLVAEAADLAPGRALDVGAGEGADALWLAGRGWTVTGSDLSSVALERARRHAEQAGLSVAWQQVDLLADPPDPGSYDLVTAHFMQLPTPDRRRLYADLAAAVAPGGTLLLVGHHPQDHGRPPEMARMFFTPEQLLADLDEHEWEVVVADVRARTATRPDGTVGLLHDTVLRARRHDEPGSGGRDLVGGSTRGAGDEIDLQAVVVGQRHQTLLGGHGRSVVHAADVRDREDPRGGSVEEDVVDALRLRAGEGGPGIQHVAGVPGRTDL